MKSISTMTAIALALGLAAAPLATVPAAAQEQEANAIDSNQDNMVDEDEWNAFGDQFSEWDANGDGVIDETEWNDNVNTAFGGEPGGGDDDGPVFGLFDVTDDNQVGEDEFFDDDSFAELDDNQDGVLDEEEFGVEG